MLTLDSGIKVIIFILLCNTKLNADDKVKRDAVLTNPNKIDIVVTVRGGGHDAPVPDDILKPNPLSEISVAPYEQPSTTNCTEETTTESFTCSKSGTFPSPDNGNDFYICHKKEGTNKGMERIKLSCPKGMNFDKIINKCTPKMSDFEIFKY